jgi:transcriptional regulator with XRE-family HTH domain
MKKILENIRKIRELNSLSQEQTAELLDKTQSAYARIERGATKIDLETLEKFAEVMNMTIIDVLTYPEKYINLKEINKSESETIKTFIQIELNQEKKEKVLNLLFDKKIVDELYK